MPSKIEFTSAIECVEPRCSVTERSYFGLKLASGHFVCIGHRGAFDRIDYQLRHILPFRGTTGKQLQEHLELLARLKAPLRWVWRIRTYQGQIHSDVSPAETPRPAFEGISETAAELEEYEISG